MAEQSSERIRARDGQSDELCDHDGRQNDRHTRTVSGPTGSTQNHDREETEKRSEGEEHGAVARVTKFKQRKQVPEILQIPHEESGQRLSGRLAPVEVVQVAEDPQPAAVR